MATTVRKNWDNDNDNQIDAAAVEAGAGSPLTTKGDIEAYDTAPTRLGVGADGQVLTANSATATGLEWAAAGTSGVATEDEGVSVDPTATTLNFVGAGVTATDAGSNITTVTIPGGGGSSPLTTKGDLYTYDTADQRLPVGTDGQILSANSATATGLEWIVNTGGGGGGPAIENQARVSRSTNQTLTSGANGFISWDTEDNDPDGYYDGGNPTRLTVPSGQDGEHLILFNIRFAPNAAGTRSFRLYKNGALFRRQDFPAATIGFSTACMLTCVDPNAVATDFYEVNVLQDSGGNLDIIGEANAVFEIYKFGSGVGGGSGGSFEGTRLELNAIQNFPQSTINKFTWNTTPAFDTTSGAFFNASNPTRLTADVDGYYNIVAGCQSDALGNSYNDIAMFFVKNGVVSGQVWEGIRRNPGVNGIRWADTLSNTLFLSAGDYIEVAFFFIGTPNITFPVDTAPTFFTMSRA